MGAVSSNIKLRFKYQDQESKTQTASRSYSFARSSKLQKWNYICLDMYKFVSEDSWVKSRVSSKPNFKLDYIAVYRDGSGSEDALVDDVWIGSTDFSGRLFMFVEVKDYLFCLENVLFPICFEYSCYF